MIGGGKCCDDTGRFPKARHFRSIYWNILGNFTVIIAV
jgi:hypothetical protein